MVDGVDDVDCELVRLPLTVVAADCDAVPEGVRVCVKDKVVESLADDEVE